MTFTETLLDLMSFHAFASIWYWLMVAVFWSIISYRVLGIPHDVITRARRGDDPQAETDLRMMIQVQVRRFLVAADEAGLVLLGVGTFLVIGLAIIGFGYGLEFAQGLFFFALPGFIIGLSSVRLAQRLEPVQADLEQALKMLFRQRVKIQALAMVFIFISAVWGMFLNLTVDVPFDGFGWQ